ncbi:CRISPR-associated protein Cas5 [Emticicia fluvialis]|uniref:CRISPR-associated protein Cas5 n=1 Tax=Emticicia fluvialis TaxID=2974474 RepID=UPI00216520F9|nr:CRISPR-associated protein Cas5 [Emticicia fluvialis]
MERLISIDLKSEFGFFRKPDANNTVNLSYNIVHKPAILGIFGAIIGLDGYKEKGKMPQYYELLKDIKLGIEPLSHEKGSYQKTVIKYSNTVGYANNGSTYLTEEATLIKPAYRVYALLNLTNTHHKYLFECLKDGIAEYIPYFGKNEFSAWWEKESFKDYSFQKIEEQTEDIKIKTMFLKKDVIKDHKSTPIFDFSSFFENETPFMYFERLPYDFDTTLFQYLLGDFVFSTFHLRKSFVIEHLFYLNQMQCYVQLL